MTGLDEDLTAELSAWRDRGLERKLRNLDRSTGTHTELDGRRVLALASNNYLGLADHPDVNAAAIETIQRIGLGSGASRLITGNFPEHQVLEHELATWKGTEDAVLFDSGYAANTGIIPALAGREDLILSDSLNHASLIDGCRLSRATVRVYPHADVGSVRHLLHDSREFRRRFIVTDGVFSMDGDLAPLDALCELAEDAGADLIVDDAHGTGVLGPEGSGLVSMLGLTDRVAVQIGTLSKVLGASGGFVAGSAVLCRYLQHHARSFVFSTAPPPAVAAGALAALHLARQGDDLRQRLAENGQWLRSLFRGFGYRVPRGTTPIIPVMVGDARAAMSLSEGLLREGVFIPAIRYPTVPEGVARLRVTASAALTPEDLEWVRGALERLGARQNP